MDSPLFAPTTVGAWNLAHRVVLAMTRLRAEPDDSPSDMMIDYYRQRASAGGLLITADFHHTLTPGAHRNNCLYRSVQTNWKGGRSWRQ
jgi:2,4-dienoyl-CoA reductase-like NADH-dependent reductase (Old Yellow Enzyme family)